MHARNIMYSIVEISTHHHSPTYQSREIPGTPKKVGPPYYSHTTPNPESLESVGMVWVQRTWEWGSHVLGGPWTKDWPPTKEHIDPRKLKVGTWTCPHLETNSIKRQTSTFFWGSTCRFSRVFLYIIDVARHGASGIRTWMIPSATSPAIGFMARFNSFFFDFLIPASLLRSVYIPNWFLYILVQNVYSLCVCN